MIYTDSLEKYRAFYFDSWQKNLANAPLENVEKMIVEIIKEHPEYHNFFESLDKILEVPAGSDLQNPFLHMSFHLAVREQHFSNHPPGIQPIYADILSNLGGDWHRSEHILMEALADIMYSQSQQDAFNIEQYFNRIAELSILPTANH